MEDNLCPECENKIIGRVDKKFCSDACRNSYNNKQNKDATNYIRNVNNILRKNRRALQELTPKGKSKVNRSKLLAKGFDFGFFTNIYETKTGNKYYFCYEYGYLQLENDEYALVLRD
jgi:hypothetical protein